MERKMKILAFAASNSRTSINRMLVNHATDMIPDAEIHRLDIHDYELPIFSKEREEELGQPQLAQDFYKAIGNADGLVISFAEHNGSYTAAYKNLYDWTSRIDGKVFQQRPAVFLATSPGKRGGRGVLDAAEKSAPHYGAQLVASLAVPSFEENFDRQSGTLTDTALRDELVRAMSQLVSAISKT